ncbi:MAG: right-handed parallel beta-helix repeat-containing protein [Candidatus Micrarchaeia archaeon]
MRVWVFALVSLVLFMPVAFLIHENEEDPLASITSALNEMLSINDDPDMYYQNLSDEYFDIPPAEYTNIENYVDESYVDESENETENIQDEYTDIEEYFNESGEPEENQSNVSEFFDVDEYIDLSYMDQILNNAVIYDDETGIYYQEFEYLNVEDYFNKFRVFLNYPPEEYYNDTCEPCSVKFACSAESDFEIESISIFIARSDENFFLMNKTTLPLGAKSAEWEFILPDGEYSWNCLATDENGNQTWGEKRSFVINSTSQNISENVIIPENVRGFIIRERMEPNIESEVANGKGIQKERATLFDSFPFGLDFASVSSELVVGVEEFENVKEWKIEKTKIKKAEKIKNKVKIKFDDEHIEGIITDGEIEFKKIENGFAVNPISSKETLVFVKAKGGSLFKCREWDFENEVCDGEWSFVRYLLPGEEYIIKIDENDPAFVEKGPDVAYDYYGYDVTFNVSYSDDNYAQSSSVGAYWVNATFSTGLSQSDQIESAFVDCEIKRTGPGLTFDLSVEYYNYTDNTWYVACKENLPVPTEDTVYACNVTEVAQINKSNQTYRCAMPTFPLGTWYVDMLTLSINTRPLDACGAISSSNAYYYLTQNIVTNSTCFTINGSNITLDCNGHYIRREGGRVGYGVFINNGQNVTIKNCNISGFQFGVYPFFSVYSTANSPKIYNSVFWDNSFGVYSRDGLGAIVENNTFYNNAYGFYAYELDYATISGNYFHSNEILGLAFNHTQHTNFSNNLFMGSKNGNYYELQFLNNCSSLFVKNTTIVNTSAYLYQAPSSLANDYANLTVGYNQSVGIVKWLKISSSSEIRIDTLSAVQLYPDFVVVNSSIAALNNTARIYLKPESCPPVVIAKQGFPLTKEDILENGSAYPATILSCSDNVAEIEVDHFSGFALSSSSYGEDGIIAYRSNTGLNGLNSPKVRFWNGTFGNGNWSSEIELQSAGSPIRYAIAKWSPLSNKKIIITQSDDGYLDAYVCEFECSNPSNWTYTSNIGQVGATAPTNSSRRFDVDFETVSGDAIVVYSVLDASPNRDLAYKVLPANTLNFSGITEQYINDTGHATDIQYTWVRLDRNPLQKDEMILVGFDSNNSYINAWVWNGNAWGNQVNIADTATVTGGYEALAVKYSADGTKGMVIGGNGTIGEVNTRYWNGTAWSAITTFDVDPDPRDLFGVWWANLKADPATDDLQAVFIDSGSDLHTAYWNGSNWTVTSNIDTAVDNATTRCADFDWDVKGTQGYLVWDTDDAGTTLYYRLCSPQCTGTNQTVSTYAGAGRWITLYRQPDVSKTPRNIGVRLNAVPNTGSFVINSSTPTFYNYGDSAITASPTVSTYESYGVAFKQDTIPPSIVFTPPTPANDSTINVNYTFINTSITDNIGVAEALLEWNGTNESMNYTNSTNWYKNKTNLAQGSYTYKVWARDYAGNWNVSETRTVTYSTYGCIGSSKTFVCSQTVTESCTMTTNLPSNGTCFTINASNIAINCAGFSIIGNGSGYGVYSINTSNFSLVNCVIGNFSSSVSIINTNNSLFKNNTLFDSQYGLFMDPSYNNTIIENQIFANSLDGLYLEDSHNNTIRNNTAYNNSRAGFYLNISTGNNISNNTGYNNSNSGFLLYSSSNNILTNNSAYNNSNSGFVLSDSSNNNLTNNYAYDNSNHGFYLLDSSNNNTLTNNSAYNNSHTGFYFVNSTANNLTINNITDNTLMGLYLNNNSNSNILTQNYICFNDKMDINNSNTTSSGVADTCDYWNNWNESGHEGCTYRCTQIWHYFFGNISGKILLAKNSSAVFYSWVWNGQKGKVYVKNGDASIDWTNLTALGRNITNQPSSKDFEELDELLGYTNEPDNINLTYSIDGSSPKETKDIYLWKRLVQYIPQANSTTQNSAFKTGIVWDSFQGGPEFNTTLNQDVVFLTEINTSATYNYEIRVPANLSTYKGGSGVIEFWVELE